VPLRVHRIPFSTNVERISLAAAYKGLEIDWVDHDPEDRTEIQQLSGQPLVPVAETENGILTDSTVILTWLEHHHPDPPLWPTDPQARAIADTFTEWFNAVWKGPPNRIAQGDESQELYDAISEWLDRFEALLDTRDFLLTDELGIADVVAFPFLKYPVLGLAEDDADPFHRVLVETMADPGPNLRAWVARIDALPRA
jgi:glutathione S-transferase